LDCIFCHRRDQPPTLFETDRLYVVPDKYPLCPGHTLIISKDHLPCYGAASTDLQRELEATSDRAAQFLRAAYAKPLFIWENGVSGQTVYHAHLHLMPLPIDRLPAELESHPDVISIRGWEAVAGHFARNGHYRYLELGATRRLVDGHSPVLRTVVRVLAEATGLQYSRTGWVKTTTPEDVAEVGRRFAAWQGNIGPELRET